MSDLDATAFVLATARPVEIRKPDGNPPDVVVGPVESEAQAPLDVLAQAIGEVKASGLNDDLHGNAPAELDGATASLEHEKTSAKSNIIYGRFQFYGVFAVHGHAQLQAPALFLDGRQVRQPSLALASSCT
jgi:hypothetical protein